MALQSSGAISLLDLQNQFGGSNPISMSEYYDADDGVPTSGDLAISSFYGKAKRFSPSYNAFVAYTIPVGAGGRGEGFWRVVTSYTNDTGRSGTVRMWGFTGGYEYNYSYGAYDRNNKIWGCQIIVDGTVVQETSTAYYGPYLTYWDRTQYFSKTTNAYIQAYLWGNRGYDRVGGGNWQIGAD